MRRVIRCVPSDGGSVTDYRRRARQRVPFTGKTLSLFTRGDSMKRLIALLFLLAACSGPPQPSALAITGATVIDVRDGMHLANSVVLIDAGKITGVGTASEVQIPSGARVVDARGKYLIPGLWDLHVHIENQRELEAFFPL